MIFSSSLLSLLLILQASSFVPDNNYLITGDVLGTGHQLSYQSTNFSMQADCNLVLYNHDTVGDRFESWLTQGWGDDCRLKVNDHGQMEIYESLYLQPLWKYPASANSTVCGDYAAVVGRPDEQVTVYGPAIWSMPALPPPPRECYYDSRSAASSSTRRRPTHEDDKNNNNIHEEEEEDRVRNMLFSPQTLYEGGNLATREYRLVMGGDCNLVLYVGQNLVKLWESGTAGRGQHCYTRLGHRGQLEINDGLHNNLWSSSTNTTSSSSTSPVGDYVLILQTNGKAVIYGPKVWTTAGYVAPWPPTAAAAAF